MWRWLTVVGIWLLAMLGNAQAQSGCCSSHGGVAGCSASGRTVCADGTLSPTCTCSPPPSLGQIQVPGNATLASTTVGNTSPTLNLVLLNVGALSVTVSSVTSSVPAEFVIVTNNCNVLTGGGSCTIGIAFRPTATGTRAASIRIVSSGVGSPQSFTATGIGVAPGGELPPVVPPIGSVTIDLIEYYHQAWDHYFVTAIPAEITKLDNGTFVGWKRTGLTFKAWPVSTGNTSTMCRFFSTTFDPKSSHFYTPLASECTAVKSNANWSFEGEVFGVVVPTTSGSCPAGTTPLYRLYNNGQGAAPNHRYTTDANVRALMVPQGWVPEGFGSLGIIACLPV